MSTWFLMTAMCLFSKLTIFIWSYKMMMMMDLKTDHIKPWVAYTGSVLMLCLYFTIKLHWSCDAISDQSDQLQHLITNRFPIQVLVCWSSKILPYRMLTCIPLRHHASILAPQDKIRGYRTSFKMEDRTYLRYMIATSHSKKKTNSSFI